MGKPFMLMWKTVLKREQFIEDLHKKKRNVWFSDGFDKNYE